MSLKDYLHQGEKDDMFPVVYKAIPTRPKKSQEENIFKALRFASRSSDVKYRTPKREKSNIYIHIYINVSDPVGGRNTFDDQNMFYVSR